MQEWQITKDQALRARLQAYRSVILAADAGTGTAPRVKMPDGEVRQLGLRPKQGLDAAGALLAYALFGEVRSDAREAVLALSGREENRAAARLCRLSSMMLSEDAGFMPASLLAGLRTAIVLLPEGEADGRLPGVCEENGDAAVRETDTVLAARTAWAGDAAVAYFELPGGAEEAFVGGIRRSREECLAGICLPPGVTEAEVIVSGKRFILQAQAPLRGIVFEAGFQIGSAFVPARRVKRFLWKRFMPCLRVSGRRGVQVPALTLISSAGEMRHREFVLENGSRILSCPRIDPARDACLEIRGGDVRYVEING